MLISSAYAQTGGGIGGLDYVQFLPIVLIFVVFYFLLIRPQQKKMKTHKDMLGALRRGDRVVTGGGIVGTITKVVGDNEVAVEIAVGVRVRVLRSTITEVLAKTEPVKASSKDEDRDEDEGQRGGKASAGN